MDRFTKPDSAPSHNGFLPAFACRQGHAHPRLAQKRWIFAQASSSTDVEVA
jgi:hypothetical protein